MEDKITFFRSYYETLLALDNDEQRGEYIMGLLGYAFEGREPKFEPGSIYAFAFLNSRPNIDSSNKRAVASRENGKLGGRPAKPNEKPSQEPSDKPTEKPSIKPNEKPKPILDMDKERDKEVEGFYSLENKNPSTNGASAGAGNPALRTESPLANKAIADTMKLREEYAELEAGAKPCPFDLKAIFDEVDRMDEVV